MKERRKVAELWIDFLDRLLRNSPGLYLGSDDPEFLGRYLDGIVMGILLSGHEVPVTFAARYSRVYEERGWTTSRKLAQQMQERGLDDKAMYNELLDIEIEVVKRWVHDG